MIFLENKPIDLTETYTEPHRLKKNPAFAPFISISCGSINIQFTRQFVAW